MATIDMTATGKKIKGFLRDKGIKVKDVAENLGFASTYPVYKWINGQNMPTLDNLVALADVIGVPITDLLVIKKSV